MIYRLALEPGGGTLVAEVALLYQSVPPEAVEPLLQSRGPETVKFKELYSTADKAPEAVQRIRVSF